MPSSSFALERLYLKIGQITSSMEKLRVLRFLPTIPLLGGGMPPPPPVTWQRQTIVEFKE